MDTTQEKRGRGRPATGTTPKRYFRADDDFWQRIVSAAELSGETASEYIRRVLDRDAQRVIRKHQ